ncbi:MAG: penicillin-insensitive murein endopeptidase [Nannocystaceae bacterium]
MPLASPTSRLRTTGGAAERPAPAKRPAPRQPPRRELILELIPLDGERRRLELRPGRRLIGADPKAAIRLDGAGLHRRHAVLRRDAKGWTVTALAEAAVYLEHVPLPPRLRVPLRGGARLFVGTYRIDVRHAGRGRSAPRILGVLAVLAILIAVALPLIALLVAPTAADEAASSPDARLAGADYGRASAPIAATGAGDPNARALSSSRAGERVRIRHEVLPGETIASIAARYRVDRRRLAADNRLNPDRPLERGALLSLEAVDPPLPRLRLPLRVDEDTSWRALSERYGLSRGELRAQNPGVEAPVAGTELELWVDPQIERRRAFDRDLTFPPAASGRSVGAPNAGLLEDGVQLPHSPLYVRRNPAIMYGSAATISRLQAAIYRFRRAYRYTGDLVVADLSRREGGRLPPHRSHQSGRDVDIWLPTLRGAYDRRYLAEDRRPSPEQVNWFAAWGLIESLLAGGGVRYVFLSEELHDPLFRAGEMMGATPAELAHIQRRPGDLRPVVNAPIRDAPGHTGHIHVRFVCAEDEPRCLRSAADTLSP